MSNWAYVSGTIKTACEHDWDSILGKEWQFESPIEVIEDSEEHPEDYMPSGSEGSLSKRVCFDGSMFAVSVSGNLRDVWSPDKVALWFAEACDKLDPMHAECEVDCGYMGYRLLTWDGGSRRVITRKERV